MVENACHWKVWKIYIGYMPGCTHAVLDSGAPYEKITEGSSLYINIIQHYNYIE